MSRRALGLICLSLFCAVPLRAGEVVTREDGIHVCGRGGLVEADPYRAILPGTEVEACGPGPLEDRVRESRGDPDPERGLRRACRVRRGHDVVGRLRVLEPQSLVLAYSAYLDRDFLRALLREGCEGAFDKGSLEELDAMISIIGEFLARGRTGEAGTRGIGGTVRAISGLVREWNLRLAERGRADAKVCSDA